MMDTTPEQQAEYARNKRIVLRAEALTGSGLGSAMNAQLGRMARSERACRGLDLRAWELTFPRVFVWHKESKRKD